MHPSLKIVFAISFGLMSCGGSGGSSSSADENISPDPTPETPEDKTDNEVKDSTPVAQTKLTIGDLSYSQTSSSATVNFQGKNRRLPMLSTQNEANIYDTVSVDGALFYGAGFDGQYVDGLSASWYQSKNVAVTSDYKVSGNLTPIADLPNRNFVYTGTFIVTRPMSLASARMIVSDMMWNVDYATGKFTGHDYPEQAVVTFDGQVEGNKLDGYVTHSLGRTQFEGGVFGPNGDEIAGGFENGGVSGVFYGDYNANLTNLSQ